MTKLRIHAAGARQDFEAYLRSCLRPDPNERVVDVQVSPPQKYYGSWFVVVRVTLEATKVISTGQSYSYNYEDKFEIEILDNSRGYLAYVKPNIPYLECDSAVLGELLANWVMET